MIDVVVEDPIEFTDEETTVINQIGLLMSRVIVQPYIMNRVSLVGMKESLGRFKEHSLKLQDARARVVEDYESLISQFVPGSTRYEMLKRDFETKHRELRDKIEQYLTVILPTIEFIVESYEKYGYDVENQKNQFIWMFLWCNHTGGRTTECLYSDGVRSYTLKRTNGRYSLDSGVTLGYVGVMIDISTSTYPSDITVGEFSDVAVSDHEIDEVIEEIDYGHDFTKDDFNVIRSTITRTKQGLCYLSTKVYRSFGGHQICISNISRENFYRIKEIIDSVNM